MFMTRRHMMLCSLSAAMAPQLALAGTQSVGGLAFGSSWRLTVSDGADLAPLATEAKAILAEVDFSRERTSAGKTKSFVSLVLTCVGAFIFAVLITIFLVVNS